MDKFAVSKFAGYKEFIINNMQLKQLLPLNNLTNDSNNQRNKKDFICEMECLRRRYLKNWAESIEIVPSKKLLSNEPIKIVPSKKLLSNEKILLNDITIMCGPN